MVQEYFVFPTQPARGPFRLRRQAVATTARSYLRAHQNWDVRDAHDDHAAAFTLNQKRPQLLKDYFDSNAGPNQYINLTTGKVTKALEALAKTRWTAFEAEHVRLKGQSSEVNKSKATLETILKDEARVKMGKARTSNEARLAEEQKKRYAKLS